MNIAVILSGGTGTRLGGETPKQYLVTEGRSMIARAMEPFFRHKEIDEIRIVADKAWRDSILEDIRRLSSVTLIPTFGKRTTEEITGLFRGFSESGETRALSILNALRDLRDKAVDDDIVIIHDAARPFVSAELITCLIEACKTHDGALPVLPMKDTVYLLPEGSGKIELLPRERVAAGQAPEAFRYGKYLAANEALLPDKIKTVNGSTEVALLEGMDIAVVEGEEKNFKVTTQEDLERYRMIISGG